MNVDFRTGDCLDVMRGMPDASVDAIVTDPPYGLAFMGKEWDHGVPGEQFWAEALRVAKPGAALLAFGGTRTFHRLACAIEDSGWRIYDCLSWMYGQGFPKHRTHLKPAWEPIVFAAKKGARFVNVEGCRLGTDVRFVPAASNDGTSAASVAPVNVTGYVGKVVSGRWPANVVLDEVAAAMLDEQSGERKSGDWNGQLTGDSKNGHLAGKQARPFFYVGDSGGASRFFYTAKASRADREDGLEGMPKRTVQTGCGGDMPVDDDGADRDRFKKTAANVHPTVKPTDLMRWLCRLVTPPGGLILDPFAGSGSTGVAALSEGFRFVGIEIEPEYVEIARRRCAAVAPLFAEEAGA